MKILDLDQRMIENNGDSGNDFPGSGLRVQLWNVDVHKDIRENILITGKNN
jgi:hypothetical protein